MKMYEMKYFDFVYFFIFLKSNKWKFLFKKIFIINHNNNNNK